MDLASYSAPHGFPSGLFQFNFVVPPVSTNSATHTGQASIGSGSRYPQQTVTLAIKP